MFARLISFIYFVTFFFKRIRPLRRNFNNFILLQHHHQVKRRRTKFYLLQGPSGRLIITCIVEINKVLLKVTTEDIAQLKEILSAMADKLNWDLGVLMYDHLRNLNLPLMIWTWKRLSHMAHMVPTSAVAHLWRGIVNMLVPCCYSMFLCVTTVRNGVYFQ